MEQVLKSFCCNVGTLRKLLMRELDMIESKSPEFGQILISLKLGSQFRCNRKIWATVRRQHFGIKSLKMEKCQRGTKVLILFELSKFYHDLKKHFEASCRNISGS